MKPCKPYIYEFLYRGRPDQTEPDDPLPAWHLQLEARIDNGMGGVGVAHKMLTMAEAEAAGWSLPKIIGEINAETLKALDRERQRSRGLEEQVEVLTQNAASLMQKIASLEAGK